MPCTVLQPYLHGAREAVLDLWRRNLPEASPARYEWLYESGPGVSWIVRDDQDKPVGSIGLMHRVLDVFGENVPAGQPIDMNVDRRWRLGGVAMTLQRIVTDELTQGSVNLVYGFPNAQSEPILRRVGYKTIGVVGRWAKPLSAEPFLPKWLPAGPARKIVALGAGAALRAFGRGPRRRRSNQWRLEVTDRFDARFDRLWESVRSRWAIVGHRDAEYLNWRFVHSPEACHRVLYLVDAEDEVAGYLVFSYRDGLGYVSDFLFRDEEDFETLLAGWVRMMRGRGARGIVTVFMGDPRVERMLARAGFRRRPSDWKAMLLANLSRLGPNAQRVFDPNRWFLTRADIDTDD